MQNLLAAFLLYSAALLLFATPAGAADSAAADEWEFEGNLYVWMPEIDIGVEGGGQVVIEFDEILENLEGLFMGALGAKKGKWSYKLDVIYFKIRRR